MPYSAEHKQQTRAKITEAARVLFNRHGFAGVTIDMVMAHAGLTRGGFYNHFASKEKLYAAAVASFLRGRGAVWRADAGVDEANPSAEMTQRMLASYLSTEHLGDLEGQCPMIALPSDVARASDEVQGAYQDMLQAMVSLFENDLAGRESAPQARQRALTLAALCVGGMVIARTLPDCTLGEEVRSAAQSAAAEMASAKVAAAEMASAKVAGTA